MVDIEPMLSYDFSNFGIKNIVTIFIVLYTVIVCPLCSFLDYNIKTEKELVREVCLNYIKMTNCSVHKVSKRGLILDKDILYLTNHVSLGDFFIDPYIGHYTFKFIALDKMRYILPNLGLFSLFSSFIIFISSEHTKEKLISQFKRIEKLRKNDDKRNIALYPEALRRPHRPNVSAALKKGFIYHSFENDLPIQLIHTTNKDYVIDDEKILLHKNTKLFTYYSSKIDPKKLKTKFEKKHKRPYTKEDYYSHVYKQWSKIWSKMNNYRIDYLISKGSSYEESVQKMQYYSTKFPVIEDKMANEDIPFSTPLLILRSTLWSIIYFIIFKIVERFFSIFSSFYKKIGCSSSRSPFFSLLFSRFPFLKQFFPSSPSEYEPLISCDIERSDES
jgi:1-acyl-sn-glycerol-3-phosphate acyltransferase